MNAPRFIIGHHIVCIVGWLLADLDGSAQWIDVNSEALVVEINTWLLTARRHFHGPIMDPVMEVLFYTTWVLIRNIFYPYKFITLCKRYVEFSEVKGTYMNQALFFVILLASLVYLNIKWTYDLFTKKNNKVNTKKIKSSKNRKD